MLKRVVVLGVAAAALLYAAPPLLRDRTASSATALAVLVLATAGLTYLYFTKRHVPAKYLVPGTLLLLGFQILPVLYTFGVAFTNFGEGHRGTKIEAARAIERESLVEIAGAPDYTLTIAAKDGRIVFLLVDPATKRVQAGTESGLSDVEGASVGITGKVTQAEGYEILRPGERDGEVQALAVPTARGAVKSSGLSRAIEFEANRKYDPGCDCVADKRTGQRWTADESRGYFVDTNGDNLIQGWKVNVGLHNFTRVVTDPNINRHFAVVFVWNFVFATLSVLLSFALGCALAMALHGVRLRFTKLYRTLLILPYAMPSFAMLLVWRSMFNTDFGLINNLLGTHINWLGTPTGARASLLLVNLWLGFPYMFLVTTGALQAIPRELGEASRLDGATAWQNFRRVTLPLLMVPLAPLLIASFAYNFNNFNVVRFVTNGGPYPVDNALVGKSDLLITYTYRIAFEGGAGQFGFAAALSTFIFAIVAVISTIAFRRTRAQEEIY